MVYDVRRTKQKMEKSSDKAWNTQRTLGHTAPQSTTYLPLGGCSLAQLAGNFGTASKEEC
jgi:hypothetical protein